MGRDRYRILDPTAPHFLTCTVLEWLPLFAQPANARIMLDSLQFLQDQQGLTLYGYVILETHCRLLARSPDLPKTLASFKSYTAANVLKRLRERNSPVLRLLAMHKARHKVDREYQVWQEGLHPEQASPFERLARRFKVSPIVIGRRAMDLRLVERSAIAVLMCFSNLLDFLVR